MRAAALIALCLVACTPDQPVMIDGSSEEAFVASAAAARSQLPMDDRLLFDEAINNVASRRYGEGDVEALRRRTFDGKTAFQIVEEARAKNSAP